MKISIIRIEWTMNFINVYENENARYIHSYHCNQRLGKIFAEANLCLTTIKWIRMSLMNMNWFMGYYNYITAYTHVPYMYNTILYCCIQLAYTQCCFLLRKFPNCSFGYSDGCFWSQNCRNGYEVQLLETTLFMHIYKISCVMCACYAIIQCNNVPHIFYIHMYTYCIGIFQVSTEWNREKK